MSRFHTQNSPRLPALLMGVFLATGAAAQEPETGVSPVPHASTYQPLPAEDFVIINATILTGDGRRIDGGSIRVEGGRISAVSERALSAGGLEVINARGVWVTPGIIDVHSHLGVYPSPGYEAHADGNEMTGPNAAGVWAQHAVWPRDPGFDHARAGGVTTLQILPGSANVFGGRTVTVKNVPADTATDMMFPGAPHGLKMACGENPKRVYGIGRNASPMTRMGTVAEVRSAFGQARDWREGQRNGQSNGNGIRGMDELKMETLAGVLDGEILVHNHCYRADEMAIMLDIAREFGFTITAFHHATEAYKIADRLAEAGTCAAVWSDWWGFKLEAWDAIRENAPMVHAAGACAIIHSDSPTEGQRLNQEAAKAMAAARRAGIGVTPEQAITWLTANAANALGIAGETGTLVPGKAADLVIWDGDPFSVYTRAERVYIDGARVYDRSDSARQPRSDFLLGTELPRSRRWQ